MLFILFSVVAGILWDHQLYLCGDNDLEYFSVQDLDEARSAFQANPTLADNIRFTVLFDRARANVRNAYDGDLPRLFRNDGSSNNADADFTSTKLVRYDKSLTGWREIDEMGTSTQERNTADKQTLSNFIYQTMDTTATNHFLEFWNHGASYVGFGVDESAGSHALLSLKDIYDGIKGGINQVSIQNFKYDIIGFDACLMSNFAVVAALGDFTEYFLFSEEVEPGYGWDYKGLSDGSDAVSYATSIMNDFYSYGTQNPRTLCILNVNKFNIFKTAFDSMLDYAMARLDANDVDVYNAIQRAGAYSKKVEGSGIDLGEFIDKLNQGLSIQFAACEQGFNLDDIKTKYLAMFEGKVQSNNRYTGMSIFWDIGGYLKSHYDALPSSFGHTKWKDLLRKLSSVKSKIQNNGVKGYCFSGKSGRSDGKNFTMSDYTSKLSNNRVQLQAILSSNVGETYADYGIETGSKVEVYGSTDGTIQEVGSGNDKEFKLTVQWDKYGTYLKDGAKEVLIFSYVTYRDDGKLTITAPLYYYPSGVTPKKSGSNYDISSASGARSATLFITVDTPPATGVEFTLYSASGDNEGDPKAEVSETTGGSIVVTSYENTFNNFHKSNTKKYTEMFTWKDTIEVVRKVSSGNQVWYMRGTAVTGDMYVYTTKKVTGQGVTSATRTQQLEAWPGMNSGSSSSSKGIDSVGGAGGLVGIIFVVIVLGALVMFCGRKPEEAIAMIDSLTGGMASSILGGGSGGGEEYDGDFENTGMDMKEAVRPTFE